MGEHWSHHLDLTTKRCSGCKTVKDLIEFSTNAARYDGLVNYCQECRRDRELSRRQARRKQLLEDFGGKCVRCGFSDWRALEFDHINSDGAADRRETKGNSQAYLAKRVRANPERFQILCSNCNSIKRHEETHLLGRRPSSTVRLQERTLLPRSPSTPRTSYNPRRTLEAEAKGQALAALVESRRAAEKSPVFLTGYWSRYYKRCLGCLGTDRSHASNGCCYKCDKMIKGYNRRVSVFGLVDAEEPAEQAELATI